jgi:hypothetical protein
LAKEKADKEKREQEEILIRKAQAAEKARQE